MKNAVSIVRQTIDDIASDLRGALFCLSPVLVVTGLWYCLLATIWFFNFNDNRFADYLADSISELPPFSSMATASMILFLAASWSAVAWHRKIIGSEVSNRILPFWNGRRVVGYFGRSFGAFVTVAIVWIFLLLPLINLTMDVLAAMQITKGETLSQEVESIAAISDRLAVFLRILLALFLLPIYFGYLLRESLILPARAMDHFLGAAEARKLTKGYFLDLFLPLGFLISLSIIIFGVVLRNIFSDDMPNFVYTFLFLVLGIVLTHLLGFGILTRLYLRFVTQASLVQH
ncbi:MAG: hypothetical protein IOD05_09300 [Rhodobacter sp.]|nr:hypothetical protein [Rhodobacter sp.]MCA3493041.1 hypothetical protein [Rhodobacter sp.]MCA3500485.1 hypothetical protein [Rhodobacter sp.]MCA3503427.1 hypothetical protein [Rhodobacter sp.]MCA3516031.1 hypothetical protein [Rhodobacter sp.]